MTVSGQPTRVKPLLLAGGKSSEAKLPKHLVQMPDGRPLYQHQLDVLLRACPDANTVYVSLGSESVLDGFLRDVAKPFFSGTFHPANDSWAPPIAIVYDPPMADNSGELAGPAAGLLAAHHADPNAAWLVITCDYPMLTASDMAFMRNNHGSQVTCLRDEEGRCEPLVGVWGPDALCELAKASKQGNFTGLCNMVAKLNGKALTPPKAAIGKLNDLHTEMDWQEAHRVIHSGDPVSPVDAEKPMLDAVKNNSGPALVF